jgi:alpha-D-ribose 1-methylphosphonate 5-triphosphate synthase subunit PhnG
MINLGEHWIALAVVTLVAALGFAGNGDLEEAERAQAEYCANVESGVWPDYQSNAAEVCR